MHVIISACAPTSVTVGVFVQLRFCGHSISRLSSSRLLTQGEVKKWPARDRQRWAHILTRQIALQIVCRFYCAFPFIEFDIICNMWGKKIIKALSHMVHVGFSQNRNTILISWLDVNHELLHYDDARTMQVVCNMFWFKSKMRSKDIPNLVHYIFIVATY